jgi:hypothetical protein
MPAHLAVEADQPARDQRQGQPEGDVEPGRMQGHDQGRNHGRTGGLRVIGGVSWCPHCGFSFVRGLIYNAQQSFDFPRIPERKK